MPLPGDRSERADAYERLVTAARKAGISLERLHSMLRQVAENEAAGRELLRDTVYGVPDEFLDDLVRVRLADLDIPDLGHPDNRKDAP